jgi:hypothetical protein
VFSCGSHCEGWTHADEARERERKRESEREMRHKRNEARTRAIACTDSRADGERRKQEGGSGKERTEA